MYCDAAGLTAPPGHADGDGSGVRLAVPAPRPDPRLHRDEAWEHYGHQPGDVHLLDFPLADPEFATTVAADKVEKLTAMRAVIQQQVESARKEKLIGSNLAASVSLTVPEGESSPEDLLGDADSVLEFFLVSELETTRGEALAASVRPTPHCKCGRCWRQLPSVSEDGALCERCASVIEA